MHGTIDRSELETQVRREKLRLHFAWQELVLAHRGLSLAAKAIAMRLALFCNVQSGRCFPSFKRLGDGTDTCESTAKRAIARLEELGLISVERTLGGNSNSNRYRLTMPSGVSSNDTLRVSNNDTLGTGATDAQGCQREASRVSTRASKGVKSSAQGCHSYEPLTCEHEAPFQGAEHVNMPSSRTVAAAPDGAAPAGRRRTEGKIDAEREPASRPRTFQARPRKRYDFDQWRKQEAQEEVEDVGCDFDLVDADGELCGVARWNGERYAVTAFRQQRRRRGRSSKPTAH